jgi:putative oxidoreductase
MENKNNFWADPDVGALVLRVTLGVLLFLHGWHKVLAGIDNQTQMLVNKGISGFFMYFVFVSEVLAPLLILLGVFTRLSAMSIILTLIVILYVMPIPIMALNEHGAWVVELQLFYLLVPVAMFFIGPGRFRVWRGKSGHWLLD